MSSDTGHTALEGKTTMLSRKVCQHSPSISAQYPSRTENSTAPLRKHKKLKVQVVKKYRAFCDSRRSSDTRACHSALLLVKSIHVVTCSFFNVHAINLLKPTGYMMHHQFNIQQLYALPTLYLCVLYLSQNKQRLVRLTA
jgi:hypothetical protein